MSVIAVHIGYINAWAETYHHPLLSEADLAGMLSAIGQTVTVDGHSITAEFRQAAIDLNVVTGVYESTAPLLRVTSGQVATYGIRHGTQVIVAGTTWYVTAMTEETAGFVALDLTQDYVT